MSFILKNDSIHYSAIESNPVVRSAALNALDDAEGSGIVYGVSEVGEKSYVYAEATAIILLEMVRGLRWRPAGGPEQVINCPAGTVFIIPAQSDCAIAWPKATMHLVMTLDGKGCGSVAENEAGGQLETPLHFSNRQCFQLGQILWGDLQASPHVDGGYLRAFRKVLTGLVMRNASLARGGGRPQFGLSNYACRQIEIYLKENFRRPVSVPDMAALVGISAGHFATCFRASFGLTPHQYLMRLRLDEVERCLRETDVALSEIAASLGFSSQSHMTTALRKYRHLTPGELRRRSQAQRSKRLM